MNDIEINELKAILKKHEILTDVNINYYAKIKKGYEDFGEYITLEQGFATLIERYQRDLGIEILYKLGLL